MKLRLLVLLTVVSLLAGTFAAPLPAAVAADPAPPAAAIAAKVDAVVLDQVAVHGATDFFIWLAEQADLSPAAGLATKEAKGRFVFDALVETAERTQSALRQSLDAQGIEYRAFYVANTILVRDGDQALLLDLAARPDVAHITPNRQFQLDEPFVDADAPVSPEAIEPNITFIKAPDVWAIGFDGANTVMAGNDTGLIWNHPAIINQYRGWDGSTADHNYNWWDATGQYPSVPGDGHGHGTHTTGTMVGDDGGSNQIGVAPGALTVHCKNMTDGGSGSDATFIECFQWDLAPWDLTGQNPMPELAPDAVNNSWGYWGGGQNQFRTIINNLQAAGILVEVSAGNEGSSCGSLRSPGDYWEVLTTGSVNHNNPFPGTITGFSSRGPSSLDPGHYFPDIMAPGEGIRSSLPGNTYAAWSGTSMSGPHATALIGLMWSAAPALRGQVEQTIQIIHDTAAPLTGQGGSGCGGDYTDGPNNDWGFGTIDALAAVQLAIALGGAGHLDGLVSDAVTGLPIPAATVTAVHDEGYTWSGQTDAAGYYTLTVAAGTFDVTASHPHYMSASLSGVEVLEDEVTTQDFELEPRGRLFGYVTDLDNGFPLDATVEADDGTSADTDPATGYYEMYLDPGSHDVTASAPDYAPQTETVAIVSGEDTQQDFSLLAAVAFIPSPVHVTLDWQTIDTLPATLHNRLPDPYPFEFREGDGSFTPLAGPDVLILCADDVNCEPIRSQLQAYGDLGAVDFLDVRTTIPGLAELEPYQAVLTWSNYTYANPTAMGDLLADYVDGGGTVVVLMFAMGTHGWEMGGRFMTESYTALNGGTINYNNSCLGTYDPDHPIMDGVTAVCDTYRLAATYLTPDSHAVAFWQDGQHFVAAKDDHSVVSIAGYVGAFYQYTGQMPDVVHNAILWLQGAGAGVPWFGQDPVSGVVPADGELDVTLLFTATHDVGVHQPGDYHATLKVVGSPRLEIPVVMTVLPAADMGQVHGTVTDACTGSPVEGVVISFDDVFSTTTGVDGTYTYWLVAGSYLVAASSPDFMPDEADVDVVAGETVQQDFDLTPLRPCLAVAPDLFEVWVITGTQELRSQTITNLGGAELEFEYREQPGGFLPPAARASQVPAPSIPAELFLGVPPAGYVPPAALDNSAPDGPWQTRASAPFMSMDNVYLDHDGKGYLVSGYGANGQVGIYNPDTNTWTTGATEPAPQIQYPIDGCFGFDADGDPVAILFNDTTSGATTLHRYNIATNSWDTPPVPAGFPANGLWGHDIASVWRYTGENVCYISGGATTPGGGNTSALYAYYPDSNTAVNLGTFNYLAGGFAFHASWYAPWIGASGAICVGGGVNVSSVVSADTQCYDIAAGVFNPANADLGPLPAGLWGMADGVLYEDGDYQLWVAQGADSAFALWPNSAFYSQNDGQWVLGPTPPRTGYRVEGTNIPAADGCSFYVVGGSSGGFSPTSGHERNYSADCPPVGAQDVPWFGQVPISGTVPAEGEIQATMLFTATFDVGVDQPGDYSCTLRVQGDPRLSVPVNMTVLPPDTMGQLHGYVLDNCTGQPVEAHIEIFGGDPITHTMTDKGTGYYSVWLYPGDYDLAFSAADYLDYEDTVTVVAGEVVALDVDIVPNRPCIAVFPEEIEVWVLYGTEVYTMPGGLDVINHGGQELEFSFLELPPLPGAAGGIDSLTGSNVTFDPSVGGDASYIPGTAQTFCFQADSYSPDWEYAYNVWQKLPADWVVSNVYVQGTPSCTSGGTWGSFSWSFATAPYEVNISHPRYHSSGGDHCTAHYCFDVTSAPAGYEAPVSWFWNGDKWGSPPYNPCSDDGYTPAGQPACDEMLHPVAAVPIGAIDVPWFWQEPESGTVPALDLFNVDILFTAVLTDPLPVGTYTATLIVVHNDPTVGALNLLVTMNVIEEPEPPIPSFESNSPVLVHEEVVFTNTTLPGIPPQTTYLWDFGDGMTSTLTHPTHIYHTYAVYTVTLEACTDTAEPVCAQFADTVQILPLEIWLPILLRNF